MLRSWLRLPCRYLLQLNHLIIFFQRAPGRYRESAAAQLSDRARYAADVFILELEISRLSYAHHCANNVIHRLGRSEAGALRDWDLMSLASAPLMVAIFAMFQSSNAPLRRHVSRLLVPILLFAVIHTEAGSG